MDHFRFLSVLFLCFLILSCTSEEPHPEEFQQKNSEPELVSLEMNFRGNLDFSQTSLKAESGDLFGIQFYDNNSQPYAFVVGNDASQFSVDLVRDQQYKVKATYIKNGQNALTYSPEIEEWSFPIISELRLGTVLNQVKYSSTDYLPFLASTNVSVEGVDSDKYIEVDRYYGLTPLFTATDSIQYLTLDMKRMIFGLKLRFDLNSLEDQTVEQVRFSVNGYGIREFTIPVVEGIATLEIPYLTIAVPAWENRSDALDHALAVDYTEEIAISIGTVDNHTRFFDGVITVQRNKMMVIDHILEEQETVGGGFGT